MESLKALLFDYGGTLDADGVHWLHRFWDLYAQTDLDLSSEQITKAFYWAYDHLMSDPTLRSFRLEPMIRFHVQLQFRYLGIRSPSHEEWLTKQFVQQSAETLRANAKLLADLRTRYLLGIISNFYGNMPVICEEFSFASSVDIIVDSTLVGWKKPDPQIFHFALSTLMIQPHEAVYIGDSLEKDMIPAKGLGLSTIWLRGRRRKPEGSHQPYDLTITHLRELPDVLAIWNRE